mgnify:FL=1
MPTLKVERKDPSTGRIHRDLFPCEHVTTTEVRPNTVAHDELGEPLGFTIEVTARPPLRSPTLHIPTDWDAAFYINDKGITQEVYRASGRVRPHELVTAK